jgi:hypothetical protein
MMDLSFLTKYAHHVRTIRFWLGQSSEERVKLSIQALETCKETTSLSLYFVGIPTENEACSQVGFVKAIVSQLEIRTICSVGIYDMLIFERSHSPHTPGVGISTLLKEILSTPKVALNLETLEVSIPVMESDTYDDLRSNLTNLRTLTLRRCIEGELGQIWSPNQQMKWKSYQRLTHLNLIDCKGAYASHIPPLVGQFSSLETLAIYACGSSSDQPYPFLRQKGWSSDQDELCNKHTPLKLLRVEHMLDWEILALGTIPVETLIITCVIPSHVPTVFIKDPEVFPGLKTLCLDPPDLEPQPIAVSEPEPAPEPVSEPATQGVESSELGGVGGSSQSDSATTIITGLETEPTPDAAIEPELEAEPAPESESSPESELLTVVEEASSDNDKAGGDAAHSTLEDICKDRGVVLRRDARWLISGSRPKQPVY